MAKYERNLCYTLEDVKERDLIWFSFFNGVGTGLFIEVEKKGLERCKAVKFNVLCGPTSGEPFSSIYFPLLIVARIKMQM